MKKNFVVFPALVLSLAALAGVPALAQSTAAPTAHAPAANAPPPTRVAIINVTAAILATGEGKKAATELQAKFNPRKSVLEKRQADIQAKTDQMRKGSATMSDEAKAELSRDIDSENKALQRDAEDLNADVDQEQNRIMQELGNKMMAILDQYAVQNGIAVVLDVSNQQTTSVLWASTAINITADMIKLYDQAHPVAAVPGAAKPPAAPVGTKK